MSGSPKILALDVATLTGWCHNLEGELSYGTWVLPHANMRKGERELTFTQQLTRMGQLGQIDCLAIEDSSRIPFGHRAIIAQQRLYGFALAWACRWNAKLFEIEPWQLKQFATGSGGADKSDMARAFSLHYPHLTAPRDDNACDAFWIYQAASAWLDGKFVFPAKPKKNFRRGARKKPAGKRLF